MREAASIVFGAAFTGVISVALGRLCLARLRVSLSGLEQFFFSFAIGAPILSLFVFLLTACHLAYAVVFAALGAIILLASVGARLTDTNVRSAPPAAWWVWTLFWCVYTTFAVVYLLSALLPEVSPDGTAYHIPLIARYLREHHFPVITNDMYASLSEGAEMLFLFAFAFGRHSAAAMTHCLFLLALPLGIISFGSRAGRPLAGMAGALLFFLSPIVGRDGTAAYNDVSLACTTFAVFYLLWVWRSERDDRWLLAIGALAGFCYAIKYTGGIATLYALGVVIWECSRQRRSFARPAVLLIPGMILFIAPWMIKNAIVVQNPIAPFGNRLFPNPYVRASAEDDYRRAMRNVNGVSARDIPAEITLHGGRLGGIIGPAFLLAPLVLLSVGDPVGRRMLLAGVIMGLPFLANIGTRFLIPALPFFSFNIALVLTRWRWLCWAAVVVHAILSWPSVEQRYADVAAWNLEVPSPITAFRFYPEAEYVNSWLSDFRIGQLIDQNVAASEDVFALSTIQRSYVNRNVVIGENSAFGDKMARVLLSPVSVEMQPNLRYEIRFSSSACRAIRVIQTGRSQEESWRISEVNVYHGASELPRTNIRAISANSNPWDIGLAFDNNPATHWTSDERIAPGMTITVRFSQPQLLDNIVLLCPSGQQASSMRAELLRPDGVWTPVAQGLTHGHAAVPPWLRRASMDFFRANALRWILLKDSDPGARDLFRRQELWGVRLVAADKSYKLYRLE